jgi:hypothetical protein
MANDNFQNSLAYLSRVIVPLVVTVCTAVLGLVFWVQSYGETHFYDKERGEALYEQVSEVKIDLRSIREQNLEILQAIGRIEGRLDVQ